MVRSWKKRKSQILVILFLNSLRVLESEPHTPTQFFSGTSPTPTKSFKNLKYLSPSIVPLNQLNRRFQGFRVFSNSPQTCLLTVALNIQRTVLMPEYFFDNDLISIQFECKILESSSFRLTSWYVFI